LLIFFERTALSKRFFFFFLFAPTLLLALGVTACGSSGGGGGDEDQITAAIRTVALGTDPAACKKYETQSFMAQNTQSEGAKAVSACEQHAKEAKGNPKSVALSKVEVNGTRATADVAFTGGGFNGQTAAIALVKEGDQWKLDKTTGFAKLDRAKLIEQFEAKLTDPANKISKSVASCFVKAVEKEPQAKVEELVLSGSSEPIVELIKSCS
jgi:hypothetical protein